MKFFSNYSSVSLIALLSVVSGCATEQIETGSNEPVKCEVQEAPIGSNLGRRVCHHARAAQTSDAPATVPVIDTGSTQ